ncbi:MAG: purine-nucleoside phosphorylase [Anaerolineales bacterium]|jgi:purine-nucleoside phosphorylase
MKEYPTFKMIDGLADLVKKRTSYRPQIGMILGSGLGALADDIQNADKIPFSELPHWPISTVEGHKGQLVIGTLEGKVVCAMQGRTHFYEGYDMPLLGIPVRVMKLLGIEVLIVTNAAGGVNPEFSPGDLMLITDHLNLLGMAGQNPLRGPNLDEFGPRFPDMSRVYDRALAEIAREVSKKNNLKIQEGVYVCLAGPTYETPADLRFLQAVGIDAVGMSTVPEVIVAHHSGIRVLGISGISNKANLDGNTETTHEEVLEAGKVLVPKFITLVRGVLQKL